MHGVEAFVNAYQGASVASIFKGMEDAGVPNNTALIFSELMDAKSLFLTANADTVYFWVNLDVTKGPIVVETPPLSLGVVDDMWFQLGNRLRSARSRPGRGGQVPVCAARLQGRVAGQRLLRPEDAHDPRHHARAVLSREEQRHVEAPGTTQAGRRADQEDAQDLSLPSGRLWHEHRLRAGGQGDVGAHAGPQIGLVLPATRGAGEVHRRHRQGDEHHSAERLQLLRDDQRSGAEGAGGRARPGDHGIAGRHRHREGQAVQSRRADEEDPDRRGGDRNGRGTNLELEVRVRLTGGYYYPNSAWFNPLFLGGYNFETPPPQVSADGAITPYPPTGARTLNVRTAMFFYATRSSRRR